MTRLARSAREASRLLAALRARRVLSRLRPERPAPPLDPCGNPPIQGPGLDEDTRAAAIITALVLLAGDLS